MGATGEPTLMEQGRFGECKKPFLEKARLLVNKWFGVQHGSFVVVVKTHEI